MKAAIVEHRGDAGSVKEVPAPQPAPHEILVRVTAAGVNPIDWKRRDDPDHLPLILGQDFAGMVSETGDRVSKYHRGERIFGIARSHGAYAEYTVVSEDGNKQPIAKIPDDVGDADAAALPTAGLTALAALDALEVKPGTVLAILGATGGVGSFAVQMAHDRGAHVIGTARSSNEQLARSLGVDEFVAYDQKNVAETLKSSHSDGIDALLDLVNDAGGLNEVAAAVRSGGKVLSTIGAADSEDLAKRNITAINLYAAESPQWSHAGLRTLLELLEQGRIRIMISGERPLAEAADALQESKSGSVDGKLVITVA